MSLPRGQTTLDVQLQPPRSWTDHFTAAEFAQKDDVKAQLVRDLLAFFRTQQGAALFFHTAYSVRIGRIVSQIDYTRLVAQCKCALPDAVAGNLHAALACLSIAATEHLLVVQPDVTRQMLGGLVVDSYRGSVLVRLTNVRDKDNLIRIRGLKSSLIGKYVSMEGTVVRMSPVRPLTLEMPFECVKCGTIQQQAFPDGKFTPPSRCTGQGCRSQTFEPRRSEAQGTDWQKIRLQEILGNDKSQEGRVPRTVEVELTGDLVGSAVVGDVICVFGEVKVLATGDMLGGYSSNGGAPVPAGGRGGKGAGKAKPQSSLFLIYLDACSVHNVNRASRTAADRVAITSEGGVAGVSQGGGGEGQVWAPNMPTFTPKDLEFVIKFTEECEGDQLRQLAQALCPGIYGHELVKAGLILALMGGVRKNEGVPGRVPIRGDIHVLVVGDPGLGKSQLLQAAAAAAPRGLYVCGNTSSTAGLTVSVGKDPITGDFVIEAGAVLLGDRGVCCVDEFDKMSKEHQALLEAMEQQEVSVAKAGMVASLPARTAILAAANPAEGHYNRAKSVAENLKMSPAMSSRFDLIFILMDRPDEQKDQAMSEHVLALHSGVSGRAEQAKQRMLQFSDKAMDQLGAAQQPLLLGSTTEDGRQQHTRRPLKDKLRMGPTDDHKALLPHVLLRKYIAYARQYVTPVLSNEAKETLESFYLELRQQIAPGASSPVTARQLESLARLTEARARVDLRQVATKEDAQDVIEIMKEALFDKFGGLDDARLGTVDYRTTGGGARKGSKAAEAARFMQKVRAVGQRQGKDTFDVGELYAVATELNLQVKDIRAFIESLNDVGDLLKAGPGQYRVKGIPTGGPAGSISSQAPSQGGLRGQSQAGPHIQSQGGPRAHSQAPPIHYGTPFL